jgi:hypothetical protein
VIGGGLLPYREDLADTLLGSLRSSWQRAGEEGEKAALELSIDPEELEDALDETAVLRRAAPLVTGMWLHGLLEARLNLKWPSAVCLAVKPVGEPDAGNRHVRFDERGGETGLWQAGLRRRRESAGNRHRKPPATAPLLDSTQIGQALGKCGLDSILFT